MPIIVVTSAAGAPGATTTALGLALTWPGPTLLVEADPSGTAIVPGWFRGSIDPTLRNLARLSTSDFDNSTGPAAVLSQSVQIRVDETDDTDRLLLIGYSDPAQARGVAPAWARIGDAFRRLADDGWAVIVDTGRITQGSWPAELLNRADQVLMVCRSTMSSVCRTAGMARQVRRVLSDIGAADRFGIVAVGGGGHMRADAGTIAREFGAQLSLTVPEDLDGAAVLSEGTPQPRRSRRRGQAGPPPVQDRPAPAESSLMGAFRYAAQVLDQQLTPHPSALEETA